MSRKAQQVASRLLEDADLQADKDWLMAQPNELPARQIAGDFGDPWAYGGTWKRHGDTSLWHINGLEGGGIKDVEPWDIEVPPEVEAQFVQQVLPDTRYETVKEVSEVMDPDDPGRYMYRDEEREIEQLIDTWKTDQAAAKNAAVTLPVYRFDSEVEDWMDMRPVRAQLDDETWERMDDAAKVIEWGGYNGFHELDSYPEPFTKEDLKRVLNLRDL